MKTTAVFLDRDGTINEEVGYLNSLDKLVIYPQAVQAIRWLNESGMKCLVVTNQSGIARGYFSEAFVSEVHQYMGELVAREAAHLDGFYFCPHHPEGQGAYRQRCLCRKPEPGLVLKAAADFGVDLGRSYLIGDTLRDIETAQKAGVRGVLVRTGYGQAAEAENAAGGIRPLHVADDILGAVRWVMGDCEK